MRPLLTILLVVLVIASYPTTAEEFTPTHQKTSAPAESRFEFIQSPLAAKGTFKLDKFTGVVYQIVNTKSDDIIWQEIVRKFHPLDQGKEGKVNYQLFASGLSVKFTFLINVNTGATWQLVETPQKNLLWSPIL